MLHVFPLGDFVFLSIFELSFDIQSNKIHLTVTGLPLYDSLNFERPGISMNVF